MLLNCSQGNFPDSFLATGKGDNGTFETLFLEAQIDRK